MLCLGIDSGGSRTRAALCDERGQELARADGPTVKLLRVSREEAERRLDALLAGLYGRAGTRAGDIARTCAGLSGFSVPWLREQMSAMLHARTGHVPLLAGDEQIAMAAARGGHPAGEPIVLVMAGTGSHAIAEAGGHSAHAGGWGPALGDEGGGTWIGHEAARLALRTFDADAARKPGALLHALMSAWGTGDVADFVAQAHAPEADFATLARAVAAAANNGDVDANAVLMLAGEELARLVVLAAGRLGNLPVRVAWTGSILRDVPQVRESLEEKLRAAWPSAALDRAETDPLAGALAMARDHRVR